jgi:hypothetical protein
MTRHRCPQHPRTGVYVLDIGLEEPVCIRCDQGQPPDTLTPSQTLPDAPTRPQDDAQPPARRYYPVPRGGR